MLFVHLLPFHNKCLYLQMAPSLCVKLIAATALTIFAGFCVGSFPTSSGVALLIGFFGGRTVNQFLTDNFVNDFANHFFVVTITVAAVFFSVPSVAQGVFSAICCTWIGSRFKMVLRQEIP